MRRFAVMGFLAVLIWAGAVNAAVIYVDAGRPDDSGDGLTWETAKRTVQAGIDAVGMQGDKVIIAPGVYTGVGNYELDTGGKDITIQSTAPESRAIVDSTILDGEWQGGVLSMTKGESSLCVISGLTITRAAQNDAGVVCGGGSSPVVEKCVFTKCLGVCISCGENGGPLITDCTFTDNGPGYGPGNPPILPIMPVIAAGGTTQIKNCVIESNRCTPIKCGGTLVTIDNCLISNNTFTEAGICCVSGELNVSNCIIMRNVPAYHYQNEGTAIYSRHSDVRIINCTIAWNYEAPQISSSSGEASVESSIVWGGWGPEVAGAVNVRNSCVTSGHPGEGNISENPFLTYDGHLRADSPCVDAIDPNDVNTVLPAVDFDGEERITGAKLDMGADEFSDADIDGLPDWYEMKYFGSVEGEEAEADGDGDGHSNIDEYGNYGSDPCTAARRIYVDVNRPDDSGDGLSWEGAKKTIQAALDAATAGDYVIIGQGTYRRSGNTGLLLRGKPIIIQSTDSLDGAVVESTIIDVDFLFIAIEANENWGCRISGLTITGYEGSMDTRITCRDSSIELTHCIIIGGRGISSDNGNLSISDCSFLDGTGFAIQALPSTHMIWEGLVPPQRNVSVRNCVARGLDSRIALTVDGIIEGCSISSMRSVNISCSANCVRVLNCRIGGGFSDGISCANGTLLVRNCTIAGQVKDASLSRTGRGIYLSNKSHLAVENSIIWDNDVAAIAYEADCDVTVKYSDVEGLWQGEGNIDVDPCFVETGYWDSNGTPDHWSDDFRVDGDYRLRMGSPCIDAGDPNYVWDGNEVDLDGRARIMNGRIDMGAYEFPMLEASVRLLPEVLNRRANGPKEVLAVVYLGEQAEGGEFDVGEGLTLYPGGVGSVSCSVVERPSGMYKGVSIMASFTRDEVLGAIAENGDIEVEIVGHLGTGEWFSGVDVLRVK